MADRVKFATQLDPNLLENIRSLAQTEGRQLQSLLEEALTDLVEKRRSAQARPHVLAHYRASLPVFGPLYERLAK